MWQSRLNYRIFKIYFSNHNLFIILVAIIIIGVKVNDLEEKVSTSPITNRYNIQGYNINVTKSQIVYVPVYSHLNTADGALQLLETTLSIRNSDPKHSIKLISARYYDTEGKKLQDYLQSPLTLTPFNPQNS